MTFLVLTFGLSIVQRGDDPRHALLAEGHEHASTHDRLHPLGNSVGEDDVQRHRQSYVAEFRHGQCRRERPRSCCAVRNRRQFIPGSLFILRSS